MCAGAGIILAGSAGVRADTLLYQNTATNLGYNLLFNNNDIIGQQIWLGTGALPFNLTGFSFEFYSPNATFKGPVTADISFYENNGAVTNGYSAPGTLFWNSGTFNLPTAFQAGGTNSAVLSFDTTDFTTTGDGTGWVPMSPSFIMPSNFTFVVTISGMQGFDAVALPVFDTPQVGANSGDYWYDVSGNWELLTNAAGPIAFGAEFTGTQVVPEPTVICLGTLGAAAFAIIARRRRQRGRRG